MGLMFTPTWALDGLPPVDPYAPPFYNNEEIPLPAWVKKELHDINSRLRDKLSPSDYLEILKGEYYLMGKYQTKAQHQREKKELHTPLKDITKLKTKLEEIYQNPNDRRLFARAEILSPQKQGIVFRDMLRTTNEKFAHVGPGGVITRDLGPKGGFSTLLSYWDARTCRIVNQLAIPHYMADAIYCKLLPDNSPLYFSYSFYGEISEESWSNNSMAAYLWEPGKGHFQQIVQEWMLCNIFNKKAPGDLLTKGKLPHNFEMTEEFFPGWSTSEKNGVQELGVRQSINQEGKIADMTATCLQKDGCIQFYKAFDKEGQAPDTNTHAENLNLTTLTRRVSVTANTGDRCSTVLKEKLKQLMDPPPCLAEYEYENCFKSDHLNFYFGETDSGYIPFAIIGDHHDEASTPAGSLLGILTPQNQIFLYDWKGGNEQSTGHFIPYDTAAAMLKEAFESGEEGPQCVGMPYLRQLTLQEIPGENKLSLICSLDGIWDNTTRFNKSKIIHFSIDKEDMSYCTDKVWDIVQSNLAPRWMKEQNILLRPISHVCYEILRTPDNGVETKLADMYVVPGLGYAIVLPNGHYAGSPGCERFLGYAEGGKLIGLKALAPWRNRPAEVLEAIGGNPDDIAALKATTERWLHKQGLDPANMPKEPAPAQLATASIALPGLKTAADTQQFEVSLQAARKAITRLEIRADGELIPQEWDQTLLIPAGQQRTLSVRVPLANGQNWIEVTPVDSMGIAGDTQRFRTIREGVGESTLYVIALGVSDYNDDSLDLQYAAKDANDVVSAFAKYGSGEVRSLQLTNSEVQDITALDKVREFISGATVNDRVVLYVAGHGMLDDNLEYHFAPAAFDPERVSETGISMDALVNCLRSSAARKHLLLLDTCHSGTLGEADMEKLAASGVQLPHGVRAIKNRGMKVKSATSKLGNNVQKKRFMEDLFTTQENTRGINIIAGTAGSEYAIESSEWKNGVFTASIVETLRNRIKSDTNADGFLSIDEFQDCVVRRMNEYTNGTQIPTIVSAEDNVMNIAVGRMEWLPADARHGDAPSADLWQKCLDWAKSACTADDANAVLNMCIDFNMPDSALIALLDAGANPSIAAKRIGWRNPALLRIAFEHGATAADATDIIKSSAAWRQVTSDKIQILKMAGADFSESGALLPYCENADAAKMLISLGADVNARIGYGQTTLHMCKNAAIAQALIEAGADVNAKDEFGNTPLHEAVTPSALYENNLQPIVPLLIQHGASVNAQNNDGWTPLHSLMQYTSDKSVPIIDELLRAGADINIRNNKGRRPQEPGDRNYAYLQQRAAMIQGNAGQSYPNQAAGQGGGDRSSLDPLIARMAALKCKHADSALYQRRLLTLLPLIRNGADVDITLPETKGNTALHYACAIGSLSITKWLLEHGANPNAVTNKGATPLMCVGSDNRNAIIQALKNYGAR